MRKYETSMRILAHTESSRGELQKTYDDLEKKWVELSEEYHMQRERVRELEEVLRVSIGKQDVEKIQNYNEQLRTELTETRAALFSY